MVGGIAKCAGNEDDHLISWTHLVEPTLLRHKSNEVKGTIFKAILDPSQRFKHPPDNDVP